MNAILDVLPVAWRPYAKAILTAVATILAAVSIIAGVPTWIPIAVSVLGSLGVYAVPNEPRPIVIVESNGQTSISDEGESVSGDDLYYTDPT